MPITEIKKVASKLSLLHVCARCGAERALDAGDLQLGFSMGGQHGPASLMILPDTIVMPTCSCGAYEELLRTHDTCPPEALGTRFDIHRRAVNALALWLKTSGKSHPDCAAAHAAETTGPTDVLESIELVSIPKPRGAT